MTDRNSKRYYWLKLNENFFEREEIKIIESMPNGKDYIIFYMKLLLKSVATEGRLKFRSLIPYTPEMLASITDTSVDTVRIAIDMFTKLSLMEIWDDGTLFMSETQNMIGSETGWARKKRKQRDKEDNVPLGEDKVPELSGHCPTEIEIDKEIDIDIDIEKDIDKELDIDTSTTNTLAKDMISLIIEEWNKLGLQQLRSINSNTKRYTMLKTRINEYSLDEVVQAIRNIDNSTFLKGQNNRGWTITFDWFVKPNNFLKVLENNYAERTTDNKATIPAKKTRFHVAENRTENYTNDDLDKIMARKRREAVERMRNKNEK